MTDGPSRSVDFQDCWKLFLLIWSVKPLIFVVFPFGRICDDGARRPDGRVITETVLGSRLYWRSRVSFWLSGLIFESNAGTFLYIASFNQAFIPSTLTNLNYESWNYSGHWQFYLTVTGQENVFLKLLKSFILRNFYFSVASFKICPVCIIFSWFVQRLYTWSWCLLLIASAVAQYHVWLPEGAFQRLEKQSESLDSLLKYASCIMGNTGTSVFVIWVFLWTTSQDEPPTSWKCNRKSVEHTFKVNTHRSLILKRPSVASSSQSALEMNDSWF